MIHRRFFPFLIALSTATSSERVKLLKTASPEKIKALSEIIRNLGQGNITTDSRKLKKLKPYFRILNKIDQTRGITKQRRLLANQSGGAALPLLIPLFATLVGGLIQRVLSPTRNARK